MKFWTKKGLVNMTLEIPEIMIQNSVYLRNHQELGIQKDIVEVSDDIFKDLIQMVEILETKERVKFVNHVPFMCVSELLGLTPRFMRRLIDFEVDVTILPNVAKDLYVLIENHRRGNFGR